MKLLLIYQHYLAGDQPGVARFNQFVEHWRSAGHEVDILTGSVNHMTRKNSLPFWQIFARRACEVPARGEILVCRVSSLYGMGYFGRMIGYLSFLCTSFFAMFFIKADKKPYDAVICSSPPLTVGLVGVLASKLLGSPLYFEIRDLWPESAIATGVVKSKLLIYLAFALEKFIYRHASKVGVVIPSFTDHLVQQKKIDAEKIFYIPNGADFNLLTTQEEGNQTFARREIATQDELLCVYAGAHNLANHLMQLIPVAQELEDKGVKFLFVGDGNKKDELIEKVRSLGLKNIFFKGPVAKSKALQIIAECDLGLTVLKKADLFKAVYSNKTFDYLSCKIPALVFIDGLSRQLVEENECGFYSPPEDPQAAVQQLLKIKSMHSEELRQMGEKGYAFVKKNFDRQELAMKYIEVIKGASA